jgi:hypothetical protein
VSINASGSGIWQDEGQENIDLNEVIADEGNGKKYYVRAITLAYG